MEAEQAAPQQAPPPEDAHHRAAGVAEALLALPEPDAEAAWQQLPREALLAEVSKYRDSIRDVVSGLRELGESGPTAEAEPLLLLQGGAAAAPVAAAAGGTAVGGDPSLDADADAGGGPDLDPEDADLLQLGDEGLDYTLGNVDDVDPSEWQVPPHCVPIHANVTTFDWPSLYEHCQFDVVMMDPPWQLATANPTRGVALGYSQLNDDHISGLPVPQLQRNGGFLFVWVINAKYKWTLDLFDKWGYRLVDEVVWVKMTVNRRLAKSHGYYLQHAKEVCLVAKCGDPPGLPGCGGGVGSDIIFSERRGQSQKPEEIYELIEQLVPNGRYLEIFARKNNLRDYWVSIGNEVTGTGLPEEDMRALKELNCIPGAVYGKTGGGGGGAGGSRAASGGSGAAAAAAGDASGGAAAQGGRGTSGGSAGGAGAARAGASSGAGQVRGPRAPSPAARAPSPAAVAPAAATPAGDSGQSAVQRATGQVQSGGGSGGARGSGGGGTAGQPYPPELRPTPPAASIGAGTAAAVAATPSTAQALEQQQPGTARPPSRLSLSIRRHAHQPQPSLPPPGATAQQQQQQPDPLQPQQLQPPPPQQQQQQQPAEPQAQPQPQGLANGGGGGGAADGAAPMETDYMGPAEPQQDASQPTPVGMSPLGLGVNGRGLGGAGELGLGFDDPLGAEGFGGGRDINMGFAAADDWS